MFLHLFKIIRYTIITCVFFISCKKEKDIVVIPETSTATTLTPYDVKYPYYFPKLIIPSNNPLTIEGINLGRRLYYDTILSNNGLSCSSCHNSSQAFTTYSSNSLAHINLAWNSHFLWNGKINGTMEDIMKFEVEEFFNTNIAKLNNSAIYKTAFKTVYNVDVITSQNVAFALSQFFRAMVSTNSLCDKFFLHTANLTPSQMNGFNIFTTERGDCFHCHSIGLFADNNFHNIGLDSVFSGVNLGRYNVTLNKNDIGLFKTPTLRNIELTAPYMHDGRYLTLEEVVEHYNSGVKHSSTLDPIMTKPGKLYGLGLSPIEKQDLVNFLKTLTDTSFIQNPILQKP
jgi:cytochrome c peroxidase